MTAGLVQAHQQPVRTVRLEMESGRRESRNGRCSWGCPSPEGENTVGRSEGEGQLWKSSRGTKHSRIKNNDERARMAMDNQLQHRVPHE